MSQILFGDPYADISDRTGVPVSTIKKIKHRNYAQLQAVKHDAMAKQTDEISALVKRSNGMINRLLDKADRGELEVSITDLVSISREMYRQTTINPTPIRSATLLTQVASKYQ